MTTSVRLENIQKVEEPLERLAEAARALAEAEQVANKLRKLRDETIRECRAAKHSIPKIASAAKVSDTTVKAVLR